MEAVGGGVPVVVDEDRGRGQLGQGFRKMASIAGAKTNLTPCFRSEMMGRV